MAQSTPEDVMADTSALAATRPSADGWPAGWSYAEATRCEAYVNKWLALPEDKKCSWEDLIVHLGDDPRRPNGWTTWSAVSGRIPTVRKSAGLFASPAAARQLTQRELFLSMGYPTYKLLADVAAVPIYDININRYHESRRALGNSMHVASVGVFTLCFLASVNPKPEPQKNPSPWGL